MIKLESKNKNNKNFQLKVSEFKQVDKKLWENESLRLSILSAIPHAVIGLKERGIIFANKSVETVFGWKPEELIGKNTRILYRSDKEYKEIAQKIYSKLKEQQTYAKEVPCRRKDGQDIICMVSTSRIGESLKNKEIVVMYEDITERKKSEETLRKSQQEFSSLFRSSHEALVYLDEKCNIVNVNPRFTELFGYTLEEVKGRNVDDGMIHTPDMLEEAKKITKKALKGHFYCETIRKKKDGTLFPVAISGSQVIINGKLQGIIALFQDITEHQKILETIKKSEERLHDLFENANDAIWTADTKGRYISVNRLFRNLLGYKKEELIGKKSIYLVAPKSRQKSIENYKKALSGKAIEYELILLNKGGERRIHRERLRPLKEKGKIIGVQGIGRDITERKQNEKLQEVLYNISKATNSSISLDQLYKTIHKELSTVIDATNFYIALADYQKDEVYFPYFVDEKDDNAPILNFSKTNSLTVYIIKTGKSLMIDYKKRNKMVSQGKIILVGSVTDKSIWLGVPLKVEGKVIGAMAVQSYTNPDLYHKKDIKLMEFVSNQVAIAIERKRAEDSLRKSQQEFASIFKSSPEALVYLDENSNIININPRFNKLFGYTLEEVKGRNINDGMIHPAYKIEEGKKLDKIALSKGYFYYETIRKKKDGTIFPVSLSASNIKIDGQIKGILSIYVDITERKKLEEKLKKYARYDTLTKACNRRHGLDLLKQQLKLAKRNKSPLLLAYIDLDDFKNVNDKFGHKEGDQVLKKIVKLFKSALREVDIVVRIGGDEFLLILPDSSLDDVPLIKKRMNEALATLNQKLDKSYKVSFTLGFSCYNSDNPCTIDELIQTADQMMYKEKKSIN
jgi:diguanylate cyclase (GGDEF)-like protein/PAS domain S-box-containing protein